MPTRNGSPTIGIPQSSITCCPSLYEPPLTERSRTALVTVTETHRPFGARHHSFHSSNSSPITQKGLGSIHGCCRVVGIRYGPEKRLRGFPQKRTLEQR